MTTMQSSNDTGRVKTADHARAFARTVLPGYFAGQVCAEIDVILADHLQKADLSWLPILKALNQLGVYGPQIDVCHKALALNPDSAFFHLLLARLFFLTNDPEAAGEQINLALAGGGDRTQVLAWAIKAYANQPAPLVLLEQLDAILRQDSNWRSDLHEEIMRRYLARGMRDQATSFLQHWASQWPVAPEAQFGIGCALMLIGQANIASTLFDPFWRHHSGLASPTFGFYDGQIAPYSQSIEDQICARIETAFALEEGSLTKLVMPLGEIRKNIKICFVTFEHGALPNDLADLLTGSAQLAGVALELYQDDAVSMPAEFRGTEAEIAHRLGRFGDYLKATRPDVVIIDCVSGFKLRGINPHFFVELRSHFSFRLICLFRDAHRQALDLLTAWLPFCDLMVVFDPLSPILEPQYAPDNAKVRVVPVPTFVKPFLGNAAVKSEPMVFVGSVFFKARLPLLAALMTQNIDFRAVYGDLRMVETPDMESYANLLGSARAVLNISRHGPDIHLVTARVWETLATGSLLVEQANSHTEKFLTPFRHYLPWDHPTDIVHYAQFIKSRPDLAQQIAREGHRFGLHHYGRDYFWRAILADDAAMPSAENYHYPEWSIFLASSIGDDLDKMRGLI